MKIICAINIDAVEKYTYIFAVGILAIKSSNSFRLKFLRYNQRKYNRTHFFFFMNFM